MIISFTFLFRCHTICLKFSRILKSKAYQEEEEEEIDKKMLANLKKLTKMKTKSFIALVIFILLSSVLVWFFNFQTSHLRSLVSETQQHIQNINSKLQVLDRVANENNLEVDSTYLELLGFVQNEPTLFKDNVNNQNSIIDANQEINNNEDSVNNLNNNPRIPPLVTAFQHFTDKEKALIESKLK